VQKIEGKIEDRIREIKISELIPDDKNANLGTDRGRELLESSLSEYGAGRSILVDKNLRIIGGNKCIEQAENLNMDNVIVVQSDGSKIIAVQRTDLDLTKDKKARKLAYADNRIAQIDLQWNLPQIEMDFEAFNLGDWFSDVEMEELNLLQEQSQGEEKSEEELNDVPEVKKEAVSQVGDLFLIDNRHRVLCGDSTKKEDVGRLMGKEKARMVVTSPPYENQREYSQWESYEDYLDFLLLIIKNFEIVRDKNFIVFWNMGSSEPTNHFIPADNYIQFLQEDYKWIEWIEWNKESATWTIPRSQHIENGLYIPALRWESLLVFLWGNRPHFEIKDKPLIREWQENVWNMNKVIGAEQKKIGHTALFPVELPRRAILSYSKLNEVIYEPFLGGGTTLIACEQTGRICYGIELCENYCDVIISRYIKLYPDCEFKHLNGKLTKEDFIRESDN